MSAALPDRTITFGGKTWVIGPLDWDRLAQLFPDVSMVQFGSPKDRIEARLRVIVTALADQIPEDELRRLPTDYAEIFRASDRICEISGAIRLGEYLVGTLSETGESPSETGNNSTPSPAPARDGRRRKSAS